MLFFRHTKHTGKNVADTTFKDNITLSVLQDLAINMTVQVTSELTYLHFKLEFCDQVCTSRFLQTVLLFSFSLFVNPQLVFSAVLDLANLSLASITKCKGEK